MSNDPTTGSESVGPQLFGLRVAFCGRLGAVNRREASRLVRVYGGFCVDPTDVEVELIVIGADELPLAEADEMFSPEVAAKVARQEAEVVSETAFWERLGIVDSDDAVRLYTPAMLAELLKVSVATVRRWHRRGLIVPTREVNRLPYFDYQEVATARRIADLLAGGATPVLIERKLAELARYYPDAERPLAQLSVIVEGQQILLRQGEGLIEPGGQLRLNFEDAAPQSQDELVSLTFPIDQSGSLSTPAEMLRWGSDCEDRGDFVAAADMYRAALAAGGPDAEICFQLADCLYRQGDLGAARERYYQAIEIDEDYVEARANLGCVLAETGHADLAIAAFEGALKYHDTYPDAHYHLAKLYDDRSDLDKARQHWHAFLHMAPESPWADEAISRLESLS